MKSLLFKCKKGEILEVDPQELDDFYKMIRCRTIDIVNLAVDGKRYDFVCDDEGVYVDDPKISALDYRGKPVLTGNLIIAGGGRKCGNLQIFRKAMSDTLEEIFIN